VKNAESTSKDKLMEVQNENKKLQADLLNLETKNQGLEKKVSKTEELSDVMKCCQATLFYLGVAKQCF
jgi:hypothetical protein